MKLKVKNVSGRRFDLPGGVRAYVSREVEVEDSEEVRRLIEIKWLELVWDEAAEARKEIMPEKEPAKQPGEKEDAENT